jgi:hypothetical protein
MSPRRSMAIGSHMLEWSRRGARHVRTEAGEGMEGGELDHSQATAIAHGKVPRERIRTEDRNLEPQVKLE